MLPAPITSLVFGFFFSSRRRHTRFSRDWSSDVCSSDLPGQEEQAEEQDDRGMLEAGPEREAEHVLVRLGISHCRVLRHRPADIRYTWSSTCRTRPMTTKGMKIL